MQENDTALDIVLGEKVLPVPTIEPADAASYRRGEANVGSAAKIAGKAIKNLSEKIFEVEQLSFLNEPEFDAAMLMDPGAVRKRYTAEQAEKLEWRRDACLLMLANEIPVEDIAKTLRMNLRTITSLAAKYGRQIGAFSEDFAKRLMMSAAADISVAETKRQDASFKDLHIGAGIKMQHATAVKLVAETGEKPVIDLEAADDKLKGLRDKLKRLAPADNSTTNET